MREPRRLHLVHGRAAPPSPTLLLSERRRLSVRGLAVCALADDDDALAFTLQVAHSLRDAGRRPSCVLSALGRSPLQSGRVYEALRQACDTLVTLAVFEPSDLGHFTDIEADCVLLIGAPAVLGLQGPLGVLLGEPKLGKDTALVRALQARASVALPAPRSDVAVQLAQAWFGPTSRA